MHYFDISSLNPPFAARPKSSMGSYGTNSNPPGSAAWQNMAANTVLRDRHILVVEDEATVAFDLEYALMDRGAKVVGPVGTLAETLTLIDTTPRISAAILDVRISGETVYPAARMLARREVPFLFHTGHAGGGEISDLFPNAAVCVKPQRTDDVLDTLAGFFVK